MNKKTLSLALACLLVQVSVMPVCARVQAGAAAAKHTAKIKARVATITLVEKKRATVVRRDAVKLKGSISEIKEDTFVVTDDGTGGATTIAYADVAEVKSSGGGGLSTRTKVAIGVGVVAAVVGLVFIIKPLGGSPALECIRNQANTPCSLP